MVALQIACFAIVATFVFFRSRLEARPSALLLRLLVLAVSAWIGEDTCIRAYGFYEYSAGWWLFLDKVPLLIVLIWPIVVQSARDLAVCLWAGRERPRPLKVGATVFCLVLADASLIEPISVKAGLWRWTEPGLFEVPPIGILGWAYFAAVAIAVLEEAAWRYRPWLSALALTVAPVTTHVALLVSWWGLFRWVNVTIPSWVPVLLAWIASMAVVSRSLRSVTRRRVPPALLWIRVPAALFFFVLLGLHGREDASLVLYALAFAPPYLSVLSLGAARPAPGNV
ncbi:MAG: carotenoid biosynthesis protein [Polyangiaceae bacterium]